MKQLKLINFIEGTSFLILVFIAMPLKYGFGYDIATKITGMTHGVLFILFIVVLLVALQKKVIGIKLGIVLFIASLIPFGTVWTGMKLKKLQIEQPETED
jgi:integral membrane protein